MSYKVTFKDRFTNITDVIVFKDKFDIFSFPMFTREQQGYYLSAIRWYEQERIKPMTVNFNDGSTLDFCS